VGATAFSFNKVHLTEVKGWTLVSFCRSWMPLYYRDIRDFDLCSAGPFDGRRARGVDTLCRWLPFAVAFAVLAFADYHCNGGCGLMDLLAVGQGMQATDDLCVLGRNSYGTRYIGSIKAAGGRADASLDRPLGRVSRGFSFD